ncbi:hypothetical protein [Flammeovirga sp. OC4]|uniref:hypothetical protein n=1 Tax=Flammeovirga sp. OC4 TaxID=1382345 RepID=UPI0005C4D394|nr:hypothetical protein [Flammeovirga sp. OC4]
MKYTLLIIAFLLGIHPSFSQKKTNQSITEFNQFFKTKDRRVRTFLEVNKLTNQIELSIFPKDAFDDFFKYSDDGISIDVVQKKQYTCDELDVVKLSKRGRYRGILLKKVYRDYLVNARKVDNRSNKYVISLGELPKRYDLKDIELNYFIIRGGVDYYYRSTYHIPGKKLPAYDLPLIYFSPPKSNSILHQSINKEEIEYTLHYKINETNFDSLEFQKLYNYLHLSDYKITSFYIKAFSSIDGDKEKNTSLSYLRAQNIINELSPFMTKGVQSIIETGENWKQFFEDIEKTDDKGLLLKSRDAIRQEINKNPDRFEQLLSQQRIATIKVRLEKLVSYESLEEDQTYELFGQLVSKENYEEAYLLQSFIIDKVKNGIYSTENLEEKVQLPKVKDNIMLHQNFLVMYDDISTYYYKDELIDSYREMLQLAPENPTLIYNLSALLAKCIFYKWDNRSIKEVEDNITYLKARNFNKILVDKLILNRWLILSRAAYKKGNFKKSDHYNQKVYSYYRNLDFDQEDKVRLAQHFVEYSLKDWAKEVLMDGILAADVSEKLLFYYINLTIIDDDQVDRMIYTDLLKKAIKMNRLRFCVLFNSYNDLQEGITFQLLDHPKLKNLYCEECFDYIQEHDVFN